MLNVIDIYVDLWQLSVPKKHIAKVIGRAGSYKNLCQERNNVRIDILDEQKFTNDRDKAHDALVLVRSVEQYDDHSCQACIELISHLYSTDALGKTFFKPHTTY